MIAMSDDVQHRVDTTLGLHLHHKQIDKQNIICFLKYHYLNLRQAVTATVRVTNGLLPSFL